MPDGQRTVNKTDTSVLHDKEDQVTGVRSRSSFSFNNLLDTSHFGRISSMDVNADKQNGLTDGSHLRKRRRSSGDSDLVVLSVVFNKKKQKQNDEVAIAIERLRENGVNCVLFTMNDFRNGTRKPETAVPDAFRLASGQLPHSSLLCQPLTAEKGLSKLSLPMLPLPSIKCELSENSNGSTDSTSSSNAAIHQSVEKVINSFSPSPSPSPPPLSPQMLPHGEFEDGELTTGIQSSVSSLSSVTSFHALLSPLLPPTLSSNELRSSSSADEPTLQDVQVCSSSSVHHNSTNAKKRRRRVRKPYTHRKAQLKKKLKEIAEAAKATRAAQRAARLLTSQISDFNEELFSIDTDAISSSDQVHKYEDHHPNFLGPLELKIPTLERDKICKEKITLASDDVITSNGVDPCLNGITRAIDEDEYCQTPDSSSTIEANIKMCKDTSARMRKRGTGKEAKRNYKKQKQLHQPLSKTLNHASIMEESLKSNIATENNFAHKFASTNHENLAKSENDALFEGLGLVKVKPVSQLVNSDLTDRNYVSVDINGSKDEPLAIASLLHKKRAFSPDIIRGIRRINPIKLIAGNECSSNVSSCSLSDDVNDNQGSEGDVLIKRAKIETPDCVQTEAISVVEVINVQDNSRNVDSSNIAAPESQPLPLPDEISIVATVPNKKRKKRGRKTVLVVRKYDKLKKKGGDKKIASEKESSKLVKDGVEDNTQSNHILSPDFKKDDEIEHSELSVGHFAKLTSNTYKNCIVDDGELITTDSIAQSISPKTVIGVGETTDCKPNVCIDSVCVDDVCDSKPSAVVNGSTGLSDEVTCSYITDRRSCLMGTSCAKPNTSLRESEVKEKKAASTSIPVSLNGSSNGIVLGHKKTLGPDEPTPGSFKRSDDSLPASPDAMQLRRSNFYSLISDNVRKNMENYLDGRQAPKMLTKRRKRTKNTYLLNHGDNYPEDPEAPYKLHLATQVLLKLNKRRAKCKPKEDRGKSLLSYLKLVPKRPPRTGKPATVSPTEEIKELSEEPVFSGEWTIPRNYVCHVCGRVEVNFWDMVEHKGEIHPGVVVTHTELTGPVPPSLVRVPAVEMPVDDEPIPPCTKCSAVFSTIPDLHRHIFECAGNAFWLDSEKSQGKRKPKRRRGFKRRLSNTPKTTPKKSKKSEPKRRPSEVFKCDFCPREFKTEGWLKNHLGTHSLPVSIPLDKLSLPSRASNNSTSCRLFKQ